VNLYRGSRVEIEDFEKEHFSCYSKEADMAPLSDEWEYVRNKANLGFGSGLGPNTRTR
jgi:hypothetical protein